MPLNLSILKAITPHGVPTMSESHQYCTFYLGDQYFGLDVLKVQEIIRSQPLTTVPLAHSVVCGLMNLRGQIVTAIDLRERLDMPARANDHESVNIIVQTDDGAVSLVVDEIGDVLEMTENQFERPPDTMQGAARDLIQGAYKLPHKLLLVLSLEALLNVKGSQD